MARVFLVLGLIIVLIGAIFGLSACSTAPVAEVELPDDVAVVSTRFLKAVKSGDRARAETFVAPNFVDDSRIQFAGMSALLKDSPPLVPAIYTPKPGMLGPDRNEVSLLFAAKDNDRWISSEIRMYRANGETFEIEYWDVASSRQAPRALASAAMMIQFMRWFMGGIAVIALLALAVLLWMVKRRTHILVPPPVTEIRPVASTVRDLPE